MDDELAIYLNDQLALGLLWREVARRSRRNNAGNETGAMLERVSAGIAEDVETFRAIMRRLGAPENRAKKTFGFAAERALRLKPNGSAREYTPLARFFELEFLAMGIDGKKLLWATLADLAGLRERLPDVDFDALAARAHAQREDLEPFRIAAGSEALRSD